MYLDRKCRKHGYKYAVYKCDSCCAVATFDCRSNHFCGRCHTNPYNDKDYPCPGGPDKCPLGICHPPNGVGYHGKGPDGKGDCDPGYVIGCVRCFAGDDSDDSSAKSSADQVDGGAPENAIWLGGVQQSSHWEARF